MFCFGICVFVLNVSRFFGVVLVVVEVCFCL